MHTVPSSLMGNSLGEAHKWVRSQMVRSNPGKPMADYTLTNENGKKVSLSDLTRGNASHVTIHAAGSVRSNPAHPAEIQGFMEIPKPMHASRLTALTQDEITPALYNAMVNEFGLFGATQTLSILLTRPVSPSLHHTQKTANLIRARKGESLLPKHRFIAPTRTEERRQERRDNRNNNRRQARRNPTPAEATSAATALGLGSDVPTSARALNRAGLLNLDLDKTTTDIRREIDRMLDDAEDEFLADESGALVSVANRMALRYENSREIFDNFAQNVLAPYLITSTANINALKYINEYILPAMREIVGSSDAKKRKLDRQYKYLVEKLATDPKDFYMGTELALMAHPAFLFPRAGLVLMPVPDSTRDMAFRAFAQIGTPPKWDPNTGFIMTPDKSDRSGVAYLNRTTLRSIRTGNFGPRRTLDRVFEAINNLTDVIERYGQTDSSGFNVLVRDTRSMAQMAGNQLYRSIQDSPAFYFADLPGIRPIPTNWPQGLIMAMMETLGANRDRITGLGGGRFNADDFLTPDGINLTSNVQEFGEFTNVIEWQNEYTRLRALPVAQVAAGGPENDNATRLLTSLRDMARVNGIPLRTPLLAGGFRGPLTVNDISVAGYVPPGNERAMYIYNAPGAIAGEYPTFADFIDNIISQNRAGGAGGPVAGGNALPGFALNYRMLLAMAEFDTYLDIVLPQMAQTLAPITATARPDNGPSVYQIMVDSVELSMRKYKYNPSKDDIYFATILLYYSLREMGLDAEITGFNTRLANLVQQARTRSMNNFMAQVRAQYPVGAGMPINPAQMNNYLAARFIYEAFNDPTSEAFRQLTGVRVNPAPAVVTSPEIEQAKETLKNTLEVFEKEIAKTGKGSQAEQVFEAMRDLIMPSVIKQMKADKTDPLFTYVGKEMQPTEKIIEIVNDQFGECQTAVKEHITEVAILCSIMAGTIVPSPPTGSLSVDIIKQLERIKGTSAKLELLDNMATAMDDFMKFLPKEVTKVERAYVSKLKDFMTIIGDDLLFDSETVGDLISEVNKEKDDVDKKNKLPYSVLACAISELREMQDVVTALDATIEPFEKYSASTADASTRYSNSARYDLTSTPPYSNLKKQLVKAYSDLLTAVGTMCGSTTDTETALLSIVNAKPDIPVRELSSGIMQPNPFESFVRGRNSNVLVQCLHKAGDLTIGSRSDYEILFETAPRYGTVLLEFFEELADDTGNDSLGQFKRNRNKALEGLVDGLYKKYEARTKAGNATKLLARDTFQLIQKTGSGIKAGTVATLGAAATTGGAIIGATATGALGGTILGATAAKEVTSAATGAVLGTGALVGGALGGTGARIGGEALRRGIEGGSAAIAAGLTTGGAIIGAGLALGSALISGGITAAGLAGSLGISAVVASHAYYKKRKEIRLMVMSDPAVIEAYRNDLIAKKAEKEADRRLATTRKEERALQLEVDMLALGAKRLQLIQLQAKQEAKAAESDAAAAQLRATEAELNAVEEEAILKATELQAAQAEVTRKSDIALAKLDREEALEKERFSRVASAQDRALQLNDLGVTITAKKNERARFLQSFGSRQKVENDNKLMKGELAEVYGKMTPAEKLREYDQALIDLENKLRRLGGNP